MSSADFSQKIDAKLKMYCNSHQRVNEARSVMSGNLATTHDLSFTTRNIDFSSPVTQDQYAEILVNKSADAPANGLLANVFIRVKPNASTKDIPGQTARKDNLIAAQIPLADLPKLAENNDVIGVETPRVLKLADPIITKAYASPPKQKRLEHLQKLYPPQHDVLIGIIDVGGFDFAHPDFLDANGETRFIRIWDQGANTRPAPAKYNKGAEFTGEMLNKAIKNAAKAGVPATQLEKQLVMSPGSHATHVASIAAGNSGVCPHAKIAGVSIALTPDDWNRRKSFYDSVCLVQAMDYLLDLAAEMDLPISINISLGTNGHAHDSSDAPSRWINAELTVPGRCVCIAAGNAEQERPVREGDMGYTMGRIHTSGKIPANGLSKDILWTIVGDGIADISENELEIWYTPQDRFSIMLKPPDQEWIGPVKGNECIENMQLQDGCLISIYNELYHFANGSNYIAIYLTPNPQNGQQIIPVQAGTWQLRLIGDEIRHGEFDGWIERDDPRPHGASGGKQFWNFPFFLSAESNIDTSSISSLACANYVIAVGNCDNSLEKIHISSSQGPTRDKRNKPEVVAPGTDITAAKGFSGDDDQWITMTGTSMASPYVCGLGARMLSQDKRLTAAQMQGIIIRTSSPLPGADYKWKDDCGFGLVNPEACLREARSIGTKIKLNQ